MLAPFVIQWVVTQNSTRDAEVGPSVNSVMMQFWPWGAWSWCCCFQRCFFNVWLSSCEAIICWQKFNKFWGGWCRRRRSRPISGGSKGGGGDTTSRNQNCSIEQGERSKGCWFSYNLWWPSWSAFWEWSDDSSDRGCGHWTSAARDWKLARNRRSQWANFVWDS